MVRLRRLFASHNKQTPIHTLFTEQETNLRAELFGVIQLQNHAKLLANEHQAEVRNEREQLLDQLAESERGIHLCHQSIANSVRQGSRVSPAAEWLLDNYHLIQEQIELTRAHLPPGYSRDLPRLKSGPCKGLPRIYDIILALVRHTDGQVDLENLSLFIHAYQEKRSLTLGELWAVPIMLRLTLIQNLHLVARRIAWRRSQQDAAMIWAKRFLKVVETNPRQLITVLGDFVRAQPPLTAPFISELIANIDGVNPSLGLALNWIEQELAEHGQTIERIQQSENQAQATNHITTSNSVTSIRALSAIEWRDFIESLSVIEAVLRRDPADIYQRMEFRTRNRYRTQVEKLARLCGRTEKDVAKTTLAMTEERQAAGAEQREAHVGFFLVDQGRPALETRLGCRLPLHLRLARRMQQHPLALYLCALTMLATGMSFWLANQIAGGNSICLTTAFLWATTWLIAGKPAIALTNWILTLVIHPRPLPILDFSKSIPAEHRTIVVVPTILRSSATCTQLLEDLEIRFLANKSPNLHFALLTDLPDADSQTLADDQILVNQTIQGIRNLNSRYAPKGETRFFLLHRPRKWNPAEGKWMGYERKRGKLEEFNNLVVTGTTAAFAHIEGDAAILRKIRYVITLDTDTQLPPGSACQMAGAMAHPLNRPQLDPATQIVKKGYGILQPRLSVDLRSARKSFFARLFAGEVGLDPYTREVANFYHDCFGQGQFVGKGIYDVQAFHASTGRRFPANRILSHDLIEGCYARCGFLSDVELFENEPSRYLEDMRRRHRWIRGDWQIAAWLLPWVPGTTAGHRPNPLGNLARWMIFDNLRRSLLAPTTLIALISAWALWPDTATQWTLGLAAILLLPLAVRTIYAFCNKSKSVPPMNHLRHTASAEGRQWLIELLEIIFLPYQTMICLDAILRALWRMAIKQRCLEWKTASHSDGNAQPSLLGVCRKMWQTPFFASVYCAALLWGGISENFLPFWFCGLWTVAPVFAWLISRNSDCKQVELNQAQTKFLRRLARRTWAYFEYFVAPNHHWLPPDNFQEEHNAQAAERTSPTNIGMALCSDLAAYDFGYLTPGRFLFRTEQTMETLKQLEQYRGHFYNWYDTQTLKPLHPLFVSTVDSGNLAGMMLIVREGLREMLQSPILPVCWKEGLQDTGAILLQEIQAEHRKSQNTDSAGLTKIATRLANNLDTLPQTNSNLRDIRHALDSITATIAETNEVATNSANTTFWLNSLQRQCADMTDEIRRFAPWTAVDAPAWPELENELAQIPSIQQLASLLYRWAPRLAQAPTPQAAHQWSQWLEAVGQSATERIATIQKLAEQCNELSEIDFDFLYDPNRNLLSIGFNLDAYKKDPGFYDLLASECRLASFIGVARGQLPLEHWFHLGRRLASGGGQPVLASWSGSMFEYLMPLLIMPTYEDTLLDETYRGAILRQIRYAQRAGIPWGISESGYNQIDTCHIYQYRAFGVPMLGMKRGLADDLVMAPYASALALMVNPHDAVKNLQRLAVNGIVGRFGFYEAVDYTPSRVPTGADFAVVRSWMAHHSGMSLLAFDYLLNDRPMQRRFTADPQLKSALLLLQERIPLARPRIRSMSAASETAANRQNGIFEAATRSFDTANTPAPEVHLLSNGRYHVIITNSGGGLSHWQNTALTRWREDSAQDNQGIFFYLRETNNNQVWSPTYQPIAPEFDRYEVTYLQGSAKFQSVIHQIQSNLQIAVCPENDIELRMLTLTNLARRTRTIEITSYAEIVLLNHRTEASHPAFHKLFVQANPLPDKTALLFTRRPRSAEEKQPWMFHTMTVSGATLEGATSFETDRSSFIGRGRSVRNPIALAKTGGLPNRIGLVIDPVAALRFRIRIEPGQSVNINAFLGVAPTREETAVYIDRCHDHRMADRILSLAWTRSQSLLHQLRANESDVQNYARLAGSILYAGYHRRGRASIIARNKKNQAALWSYGISGDRPIVLLSIADQANLDLVRNTIQAHSYWRQKGIETDLVIWSEAYAGYRQNLLDAIIGLVQAGTEAKMLDQPGGIFVRNIDQVPKDDRILFAAAARIVLSDRHGTFADQIDRRVVSEAEIPLLIPAITSKKQEHASAALPFRELEFFNGYGGFTHDGREYVIHLEPGTTTPAPWVNILANPQFGTLVSESGSAYTWSENAHQFRLTPWSNDAVSDPSGEVFYIRDEDSGRFWSPTPLPAAGKTPYVCRHGHGYTVFEHIQNGLFSEMTVYTAIASPLKFNVISIRNLSNYTRRISVTGYCEWVLGERREQSAMHVASRLDPQSGALFAQNAFSLDFADRIAFFHCSSAKCTLTANRTEFIGRNGNLADPSAMRHERLSNVIGTGADPCAAIMAPFAIAPGEQIQVVFTLGAARNENDARSLLRQQSGTGGARQALEEVWQFWQRQLGGIYIETPDNSVNFLVNHWLLYQTLSARFWGRSGFYQSSGAYGFRDQLQDSLAFLHECPWLTRQHLLVSAARQFVEGDVQHWWHPPVGRGVRTRISDDLLWLPFVACRYADVTGDFGIFKESLHFLETRPLAEGEESAYDQPRISEETGTLYEHCKRAILRAMRFGTHELPLIGAGDWNDGMNRIGHQGHGESVWMGFFMYRVLMDFAPFAQQHNDSDFSEQCLKTAEKLSASLDFHAWDGDRYLRAFFDDGTPLGSSKNSECKIDSLPQSWAALSGACDPARAASAMQTVMEQLVDPHLRLIRLFDPPFDATPYDPGYIKGYVPGVRENGGQYTHAAVWVAMAAAVLRQADRAWELCRYLNPILHGDTRIHADKYKIEPYVLAADIYTAKGHEGTGGWSWYTGSSAWLYQLLVEHLLGIRLKVDTLAFEPLFPKTWDEFKLTYRYRSTFYHIQIRKIGPETWKTRRLWVDDVEQPDRMIHLVDDGRERHAFLEVG